MKKRTFSCELAYVFGMLTLAFGSAMMEKAEFGMSMVVAPAYVLYRALSPALPFFTFGMAEYTMQAALLAVLFVLLRRVRVAYLLSFVTAVLYGLLLDASMAALRAVALNGFAMRVAFFGGGMALCATGVSLMFHTYLPPEVYELFVKVLSGRYGIAIARFKTAYDCVSCLVAIVLSFACFGFGRFVGVQAGTIVCALVNGSLIGLVSRFLDAHFRFTDRFSLRPFFES